jgi:hypothetical protein
LVEIGLQDKGEIVLPEDNPVISEATHLEVKRLLSQKAKRFRRPSERHSEVLFAKEMDLNRDFAKRQEGNGAAWFFGSLVAFAIMQLVCERLGVSWG